MRPLLKAVLVPKRLRVLVNPILPTLVPVQRHLHRLPPDLRGAHSSRSRFVAFAPEMEVLERDLDGLGVARDAGVVALARGQRGEVVDRHAQVVAHFVLCGLAAVRGGEGVEILSRVRRDAHEHTASAALVLVLVLVLAGPECVGDVGEHDFHRLGRRGVIQQPRPDHDVVGALGHHVRGQRRLHGVANEETQLGLSIAVLGHQV